MSDGSNFFDEHPPRNVATDGLLSPSTVEMFSKHSSSSLAACWSFGSKSMIRSDSAGVRSFGKKPHQALCFGKSYWLEAVEKACRDWTASSNRG